MQIPHLTIGHATVHLLNDGFWWDDGGAMFGVVPRPLWEREHPADQRNRIHMSLVCPLVVADREVILVDAGIGDRLGPKEAGIYRPERGAGLVGQLALLGLAPEDVTMVILSHLHFDHCGGIVRRGTDDVFRATFPRARHVVQGRELRVALSPPNARLAAAYGHVRECLDPLAGHLVQRIDGSTSLTPSVRTVVTGGHTPTHQCVVIESDGTGLVHLADLAPTTSHLRPAWTAAYDLDPMQVLEEKDRILTEVVAKSWWVSFDHDVRIASARLQGGTKGPTIAEFVETRPLG
jgi:glyoxylase-like metal-dependent hydrolase (beta-lactamase superfamily II)